MASSLLDKVHYLKAMNKPHITSTNLKTLVNRVRKYDYSIEINTILLKIDAYANLDTDDYIDYFKDLQNEPFVRALYTKIFLPYLTEKFIIFQNIKGQKTISKSELNQLYNDFNNMSTVEQKNDGTFISELFFYIGNEQIPLQERDYQHRLFRFYKTFKFRNDIDDEVLAILSMSMEKFTILCWALYAYIHKIKKIKIVFNTDSFKKFVLNADNDYSEENLESFIKYISLPIEQFKNEYLKLRKIDFDENNNLLSYDEQSKIDKFLPKISFYYPFYIKDNNYYITSFTSIVQFLRLERVYNEISEQLIANNKTNLLGKSIESYVKNEIENYKVSNSISGSVFGGKEYKPNRKLKFDEPDVIFETDEYMIIIECKTSAFHLIKSLHSFKREVSNRIENDLEKSIKNVDDRYLHYNPTQKKIYKFLMYFNASPIMLNSLKFELFDNTDFILTDISSIENLFRISEKSLSTVIDNFLDALSKHQTHSLYDFVRTNYKVNNKHIEDEFNKIAKDILID